MSPSQASVPLQGALTFLSWVQMIPETEHKAQPWIWVALSSAGQIQGLAEMLEDPRAPGVGVRAENAVPAKIRLLH